MALHFPLAEWEALYVIASPTFSSWNTCTPLQVYICTEGNPSITIDLSHDDCADGGHEERWGGGQRAALVTVYVWEKGDKKADMLVRLSEFTPAPHAITFTPVDLKKKKCSPLAYLTLLARKYNIR